LQNGTPPNIAFATNPVTVVEDAGTATLTLQLDTISGSDVTGDIILSGASTATPTDDFSLVSPTSFTIPAGSTTADIDFSIVDDLLDEEDSEFITIEVINVVGATPPTIQPPPGNTER